MRKAITLADDDSSQERVSVKKIKDGAYIGHQIHWGWSIIIESENLISLSENCRRWRCWSCGFMSLSEKTILSGSSLNIIIKSLSVSEKPSTDRVLQKNPPTSDHSDAELSLTSFASKVKTLFHVMARGGWLSPGVGLGRFMDIVQRILGSCPRKQQFPTPEKETEAWKHDQTAARAVHTSNQSLLRQFLQSKMTLIQGFSTNSQLPKAQHASRPILDRPPRLHHNLSIVSSLSDQDTSTLNLVSIVLRTFKHQHFRCLQGDSSSCTAGERVLDLWRLLSLRGSLEEGEKIWMLSSQAGARWRNQQLWDTQIFTKWSSWRQNRNSLFFATRSKRWGRTMSFFENTGLVLPPWSYRPSYLIAQAPRYLTDWESKRRQWRFIVPDDEGIAEISGGNIIHLVDSYHKETPDTIQYHVVITGISQLQPGHHRKHLDVSLDCPWKNFTFRAKH